jgi:uncharacterized protein YbaR (Trm112 family)
MLTPDLLEILRCPETHQKLTPADGALVTRINNAIGSKTVRNRAGQVVADNIEGGLVREDGKFLYAIRNNIPVMLIDEAIPLPLEGV